MPIPGGKKLLQIGGQSLQPHRMPLGEGSNRARVDLAEMRLAFGVHLSRELCCLLCGLLPSLAVGAIVDAPLLRAIGSEPRILAGRADRRWRLAWLVEESPQGRWRCQGARALRPGRLCGPSLPRGR